MAKESKIPYDFNAYRREVMKALCLTKLSGRDFRVLLLILGQTDGYHRSQDKIKPAFFVERTGLDKSNIRVTIARLRKLNMIDKSGLFYEVLPPNQWDKEIFVETQMRINIDALLPAEPPEKRIESDAVLPPAGEEKRIESDAVLPPAGEPKRIKSDAPTASIPMRQELKSDALLASSIENPSIENLTIENSSTKVEEGKSPDSLAAQTPAAKYLFEKTSRKRWKNLVQKEEFEKVEAQVGEARMKGAIDWALLSGISNIKSILTAAKKGGRRDTAGREQPPGRGSGAHREGAGEGDKFSGFRAIKSGPGEPDDREED
ncbi:hypothetical protein ES703_112971 [subsurface metagenome]